MTVNELIKELQKLKRKNKYAGDWDVIVVTPDEQEIELREGLNTEYWDCVALMGE